LQFPVKSVLQSDAGRIAIVPSFVIFRHWRFFSCREKITRPNPQMEKPSGLLQNKLNFLRNNLMKIAFSAG
jgi:hypothetical protein